MVNRLAAEADSPLLASQSSYQMSTAALALLEDVKARRRSSIPISSISPFPDFDRTLQTLSGEDGGGFSFNLDLKLAEQVDTTDELPELNLSSSIPFHGSYMDAFPALRTGSTYSQLPSSNHAHGSNNPIYDPSTSCRGSGHQVEKSSSRGPSYVGSFNPFSDPSIETIGSSSSDPSQQLHHSPVDEERKMSRFGFARGRQTSTAASSPLPPVFPLSYPGDQHLFYQTIDSQTNPAHSWQQSSETGLFMSQHIHQATQGQSTTFLQTSNQLFSLNGGLSESQLRNFILSSHEQANESNSMTQVAGIPFRLLRFSAFNSHVGSHPSTHSSHPFEDPAIMSASFTALPRQQPLLSMAYGPPPGLSAPPRSTLPLVVQTQQSAMIDGRANNSQGEFFVTIEGREVKSAKSRAFPVRNFRHRQ